MQNIIYSKNNSIKKIFIVFYLLITVIPIVVVMLFSRWFFTEKIVNRYLYDYLENIQSNIETNMNAMIYQINMLTLIVNTNENINNTIERQDISTKEKQEIIGRELQVILGENRMIEDLVLYTRWGESFRYNQNGLQLEEVGERFMAEMNGTRLLMDEQIRSDKNGDHYIILGKRIWEVSTGYDLGYVFVYVNCDKIYNLYNKLLWENSYSCLMADNVNICDDGADAVYINQGIAIEEANSFTASSDGEYIIANYDLSQIGINLDWRIISVIPHNKIYDMSKNGVFYIAVVAVCGIAAAIVMAYILSGILLKSIQDLNKNILLFVETGTYIKKEKKTKNELILLEESYDKLINHIDELIEKNNEEREKQKKSELKALQSQINPHFIYNAMDAICWMAKIQKQYNIETAIHSLSSFLRIGLHGGSIMISVKDELRHVQSYIDIQQMCMPGRFTVDFDVDDEIMNRYIIKLILQPLVENSIKHGFARKKEMGHINIKGYEDDGYVCFIVSDNGSGIKMHDNIFKEKSNSTEGGYGLYSIKERLSLLYGEDYELEFSSNKVCEGTTVKMRVPIR